MNLSRLLLFVIAVSFASCSKDFTFNRCSDHTVRIRVENKTSLPATALVMNGEALGTVAPGATSAYHSFSDLMNTPVVSFYNDTTHVTLALFYCGTGMPQPAYLENGDYVYTLTADNTAYFGCTFTFRKE